MAWGLGFRGWGLSICDLCPRAHLSVCNIRSGLDGAKVLGLLDLMGQAGFQVERASGLVAPKRCTSRSL